MDRASISIGVAHGGPRRFGSAEALMHHADRAMYEAKRTGRNRVATSETPIGDAELSGIIG